MKLFHLPLLPILYAAGSIVLVTMCTLIAWWLRGLHSPETLESTQVLCTTTRSDGIVEMTEVCLESGSDVSSDSGTDAYDTDDY